MEEAIIGVKDGYYDKPKIFQQGVLVFTSNAPSPYINAKGKESDAWLKYIAIVFANKKRSKIKVAGWGIVPEYSRVLEYRFTPSWKGKVDGGTFQKEFLTLENAFVPEEITEKPPKDPLFRWPDDPKPDLKDWYTKSPVGDITLLKVDIPSWKDRRQMDNEIFPWSYSATYHRGLVLHGTEQELTGMIKTSLERMHKIGTYELIFSAPCCANSHKHYKLELKNTESLASKLAADVLNKPKA